MKCEWNENKLGDFCDVKGGKRLPKGVNLVKENSGHPYIRIRDLTGKKVLQLNDDFEFVDEDTQKTISRYIVDTDDILISIVGTIGLISIVGNTLHHANLTENCVKLANLHGIDRQYLYYYLISAYGQNEIRRGTVGAVQPKLPIKNIQDITVIHPSNLITQRRIADILSTLDEKIALNNAINNNLAA